MPIRNYTLDEIYIGDEVTFQSKEVDTEDLPWIVTRKIDQTNEICIKTPKEAIKEDWWTLNVKDVIVVIPASDLRKTELL